MRLWVLSLTALVAVCGSCSAKPQQAPDFGKVLHHMLRDITDTKPNVTYVTINGRPCIDNLKAVDTYQGEMPADVGERLANHARKVVVHAVRGFLAALHPDGHVPNCSDLVSGLEAGSTKQLSQILTPKIDSDVAAEEPKMDNPVEQEDKVGNQSEEDEGNKRQSKILSVTEEGDAEVIQLEDDQEEDKQHKVSNSALPSMMSMHHAGGSLGMLIMGNHAHGSHMHMMEKGTGDSEHRMNSHDDTGPDDAVEIMLDNEDDQQGETQQEQQQPTLDEQLAQNAALNQDMAEEELRQGTYEVTLITVRHHGKMTKNPLWTYLIIGSIIATACLIPLSLYCFLKMCSDDSEPIEIVARIARRMKGQRLNNEEDDEDQIAAEAENQKNDLAATHSDKNMSVKADGDLFFVTSHI